MLPSLTACDTPALAIGGGCWEYHGAGINGDLLLGVAADGDGVGLLIIPPAGDGDGSEVVVVGHVEDVGDEDDVVWLAEVGEDEATAELLGLIIDLVVAVVVVDVVTVRVFNNEFFTL